MGYLKGRSQRVKINTSFSTWAEILCGVPQGSVLGPLLFNIYLNDLFFILKDTEPCNFADDTMPFACGLDITSVVNRLEKDSLLAIVWFEENYMKLNEDKCHFLICGPTNAVEHLWVNVGDTQIKESKAEKLLGAHMDKSLKFDMHVSKLCSKVSTKVTILARISKHMTFEKEGFYLNFFLNHNFHIVHWYGCFMVASS